MRHHAGMSVAVRPRIEEPRHGGPPPPVDPDEGGGGGDGLRVVAVFNRVWEAELARGALDEAGVPAIVDPSSLANPYPSLAAVGWNPARLLVRARHYDEARRILAELDAPSS